VFGLYPIGQCCGRQKSRHQGSCLCVAAGAHQTLQKDLVGFQAQGNSAFQQTVSQGISYSYVRWRGIEATLQLVQSPNSKIV
jgi:hypothetical protein